MLLKRVGHFVLQFLLFNFGPTKLGQLQKKALVAHAREWIPWLLILSVRFGGPNGLSPSGHGVAEMKYITEVHADLPRLNQARLYQLHS